VNLRYREGVTARVMALSEKLPDGLYPFANEMFPLSELGMMEAPPELEALLIRSAAENGIEILRDKVVELRCEVAGQPEATFVVFWPSGQERVNILAPKLSIKGRA
jgi:hypothetical protein